MTKTWINKEKGDDLILAIGNNKLYKSNPKEGKIDLFLNNIENDVSHIDILSIPFSYLRSIQLQKDKKYIQVNFGKESEEFFRVNDELKRVEIFKYLKENIPAISYEFDKYTIFKSIKKPLIALIVILLMFIWTMYYAIQLSAGTEYELIGNGASLGSIAFAVAISQNQQILIKFLFFLPQF